MSISTAPAPPEGTDPLRDGATGGGGHQLRTPEPGGTGEGGAAPLWLLAGVEQDEGPEPHIRRGID